jgi:hypothetical protein
VTTGAPLHVVDDLVAWAGANGFVVGGDNAIVIDSIEDIDDAAIALGRGLADEAIAAIIDATLPVAVRLSWDTIVLLLPVLRAADSAHRPFRFEVNPAVLPAHQIDVKP